MRRRRSLATTSARIAFSFQAVALVGDLLSAVAAFWFAYLLRYRVEVGGNILPADFEPFSTFLRPLAICLVLTFFIFPLRGMYRLPRGSARGVLDDLSPLTGGFTTVMAGVVMLAFFLRFAPSRLVFLYAWLIGIGLMLTHRLVARGVRHWLWRQGVGVDRVLIVGEGESSRRIMQSLLGMPHLGYRLVGYVGAAELGDRINVATEGGILLTPRLGTPDQLGDLVTRHRVDEVIIFPDRDGRDQVLDIIRQCQESVVKFRLVPDLLQFSLDRVAIDEVGGLPLIGIKDASIRGWNAFFKRTVDILVATVVLTVSAIPMAVIAFMINRDSPGGVIYRQTRIGKGGRPFTMMKFRCMVDGADEMWRDLAATSGNDQRLFKMRDDPRVTRVGKKLRRLSIDELPQFFQVLTGEMSLIGPRPSLQSEIDNYEPWHRQRLLVQPGLTGLWQVNGRSDLSFDEMVRLDLYYAENWSPWLDLKIALRTIPAVVLARGAY